MVDTNEKDENHAERYCELMASVGFNSLTCNWEFCVGIKEQQAGISGTINFGITNTRDEAVDSILALIKNMIYMPLNITV